MTSTTKKAAKKSAQNTTTTGKTFTDEERAAIQERARELTARSSAFSERGISSRRDTRNSASTTWLT